MEEIFSANGLTVFRTKHGVIIKLQDNSKVSVHVKANSDTMTIRPRGDDKLNLRVIAGAAVVQVTN